MSRIDDIKRAHKRVLRRARYERERADGQLAWSSRQWLRIKADPAAHEAFKAQRRASGVRAKQWAALKQDDLAMDEYRRKRALAYKARMERMTDEQRAELHAQQKRWRAARKAEGRGEALRWERIKASPELHEKHREQTRRSQAKARSNPARVAKQREYDRAYQARRRAAKRAEKEATRA